MQCTGLKDKNGKLIFERDVVKDVSSIGDFDDSDALACLFTCGLSSVAKGVGKTIEKSVDKLDE